MPEPAVPDHHVASLGDDRDRPIHRALVGVGVRAVRARHHHGATALGGLILQHHRDLAAVAELAAGGDEGVDVQGQGLVPARAADQGAKDEVRPVLGDLAVPNVVQQADQHRHDPVIAGEGPGVGGVLALQIIEHVVAAVQERRAGAIDRRTGLGQPLQRAQQIVRPLGRDRARDDHVAVLGQGLQAGFGAEGHRAASGNTSASSASLGKSAVTIAGSGR